MTYTVFRVHYRTKFGDFISIRGSAQGLAWHLGLQARWETEKEEDVWVLSLEVDKDSEEENVEFKPLVNDETWAKGPNYKVKAGETIDIYPFFFSNQGHYFKTNFHSASLGNTRRLAIYLPPSYEENTFKRYPVILFQDGHNLFDTEDSFCGDTWQLDQALDDLSCHGGIKECIIVGIYPVSREWEYLPTSAVPFFSTDSVQKGGGADSYLDALVGELKPQVDRHLRTIPDSYGIAGSSYGGMLSFYAWVTRPDDFAFCGAFSPSLRWDNRVIFEITKNVLTNRPNNHKVYLDCGSNEGGVELVAEMTDYLRKKSFGEDRLLFVEGKGHNHSEKSWAARTPKALSFLLADPERVQG